MLAASLWSCSTSKDQSANPVPRTTPKALVSVAKTAKVTFPKADAAVKSFGSQPNDSILIALEILDSSGNSIPKSLLSISSEEFREVSGNAATEVLMVEENDTVGFVRMPVSLKFDENYGDEGESYLVGKLPVTEITNDPEILFGKRGGAEVEVHIVYPGYNCPGCGDVCPLKKMCFGLYECDVVFCWHIHKIKISISTGPGL